jgi:hypothetical protein
MSNDKIKTVNMSEDTFKNVIDNLDHLSKLMNDMIVDMHNVKGGQQVRHSYMLYRKYLWDIKDELKKGIINEQQ